MTGRTVSGALTAVEKERGRKLTAKQKKFLKLYAENEFKQPRECALKAGYAQSIAHKVASDMKEEVLALTQDLLLTHAPSAAMTLVETMNSDKPIPNGAVKLKSATEILDRAGIGKIDKVEHDHKVSGGLFFLPVKQEVEEIIEGEVVDG